MSFCGALRCVQINLITRTIGNQIKMETNGFTRGVAESKKRIWIQILPHTRIDLNGAARGIPAQLRIMDIALQLSGDGLLLGGVHEINLRALLLFLVSQQNVNFIMGAPIS